MLLKHTLDEHQMLAGGNRYLIGQSSRYAAPARPKRT